MSDLSRYSDEDILNIVSSDTETELKKRGYSYGWYKKESFVGYIYIFVNPAFPELVKIGYTDDVDKRLKTFNRSSGLPDPYHCYAVYKVKSRLKDLKLHSLIDTLDPSLRHAKNREFYEMNCEKAYEILSAIAQINGDEEQLSKNPFSDSFFDEKQTVKPDNKESKNDDTQKLPPLKFNMIGLPVGSTLVFTKDNSITCKTTDDLNHVEYNGEIFTISGLAKKIVGFSVAGPHYFMYKGELLSNIRKRLGV